MALGEWSGEGTSAQPEIKDPNGQILSPAVGVDQVRLEREIKAERAAGALKTPMSHGVKVLIRDCEDDPIMIWETLKASPIQQRTAPRLNAYHALLSVQKGDSESFDALTSKADERIRIIKLLSPTSFTLGNLYDELTVHGHHPGTPLFLRRRCAHHLITGLIRQTICFPVTQKYGADASTSLGNYLSVLGLVDLI